MRRALSGLFGLMLLLPLGAQAQEIELASYTPEQRWERAASQLAVSFVAGISYAKSMGQTAEDYGEALADLFAPGWGEPGSGSLAIVQGLNLNFSLWPDCEFEIVEQTGTTITVRSNRPWTRYFGEDEMWYGVSVSEFERTFEVFDTRLAEYLGLGYEDWMDDGWWYFKFTLEG